jgi:hypothetical protein
LHIDDTRHLIRRLETKVEAYEKIVDSEILTLLGMHLLDKAPEVSKHEAPYLKPSVNWLSRGLAEAKEWLRCISKEVRGLEAASAVGGSIPQFLWVPSDTPKTGTAFGLISVPDTPPLHPLQISCSVPSQLHGIAHSRDVSTFVTTGSRTIKAALRQPDLMLVPFRASFV